MMRRSSGGSARNWKGWIGNGFALGWVSLDRNRTMGGGGCIVLYPTFMGRLAERTDARRRSAAICSRRCLLSSEVFFRQAEWTKAS